jgi:hypothetical protein
MTTDLPSYIYLGDALTDPRYSNQPCTPVLKADGTPVTVIQGRRPRNQLVQFMDGTRVVVLGARLIALTDGYILR